MPASAAEGNRAIGVVIVLAERDRHRKQQRRVRGVQWNRDRHCREIPRAVQVADQRDLERYKQQQRQEQTGEVGRVGAEESAGQYERPRGKATRRPTYDDDTGETIAFSRRRAERNHAAARSRRYTGIRTTAHDPVTVPSSLSEIRISEMTINSDSTIPIEYTLRRALRWLLKEACIVAAPLWNPASSLAAVNVDHVNHVHACHSVVAN